MLTVVLFAQVLYLLASLVVTAKLVISKKSVLRGGLCLYGLSILGAMVFCVVFPGVLVTVGADEHAVVGAFPEATGVLPVILVSWFPAFAFAGLVRVASRKTPDSQGV